MPKLTINGQEVEVLPGMTVIQACDQIGVEVPRFCYHERLSISGNCRMCLVEMERAPRPVAACAMPASDGMVIRTDSEKVRKMRQGVLEFLLINHPLDCPICDQGGECDLQDLTMNYGRDRGRFSEVKRAVREKKYGPLIKPTMTRCIHCTRCIRFCRDVAGVPELGGIGRGSRMEVGTYVEKVLSSELSGNIIDLCPVGALTSKPYAFTARCWELEKTESVDVMDAVGSNIRIDSRGLVVMRVLPRINEDINEEWISDKTRFAYDGLKRQRLDKPYVRHRGKLIPASWDEALASVAKGFKGLKGREIAALAGDLADCESMKALHDLMTSLGSPNLDCRQDFAAIDPSWRAGYVFNATIAGIERAGACLLIGTNPRIEAPIINARLRKRSLMGGFSVAAVGPEADLTYKCAYLGDTPDILAKIAAFDHPFADVLRKAERPMLILGMGALARDDGSSILATARKIAESCGMIDEASGWNGFNVLHTAAARVGGLDLGFVPGPGGLDAKGILDGAASGMVKAVYLLGADEIDVTKLGGAFVVYQGHHGDAGALRADVVLPGAAYTEKNATYVNTEGRAQRANLAVFPPGEASEDWKIIRALSEIMGRTLPYDDLDGVRAAMSKANSIFDAVGEVKAASWGAFGDAVGGAFGGAVGGGIGGGIGGGAMLALPLRSPIVNFYMTDPISRCSVTMANCVAALASSKPGKSGTDG